MLTLSVMGFTLLAAAESGHIDVPKGSVICNSEALAERYLREEATPMMDAPGCSRIGVDLKNQVVLASSERIVQIQMTDGRTRRVRYLIVEVSDS